jgi:hypothetical protein
VGFQLQCACVNADLRSLEFVSGALNPPGQQPSSQEGSGYRVPDDFAEWLGDFVGGEAFGNCLLSGAPG